MNNECSFITISAFAYNESKINKKIHATAINFVIMSVALLQFFMIVFSLIRSLDSDVTTLSSLNPRTKVAMGLFILTINICSAQIWSNTCKKISPIKYDDVLLANDPDDENSKIFLPQVLKAMTRDTESEGPSPATHNTDYQTF